MSKQVKAFTFNEVIEEVKKKSAEIEKEFRESGGKCVNCKINMADVTSSINPFHCETCNNKTEEILKKLRGPGFVELRIPKGG